MLFVLPLFLLTSAFSFHRLLEKPGRKWSLLKVNIRHQGRWKRLLKLLLNHRPPCRYARNYLLLCNVWNNIVTEDSKNGRQAHKTHIAKRHLFWTNCRARQTKHLVYWNILYYFDKLGRVLLQLRYLQTLSTISAEKNSTIIFPLPIDIISQFMKKWPEGKSQLDSKQNYSCFASLPV